MGLPVSAQIDVALDKRSASTVSIRGVTYANRASRSVTIRIMIAMGASMRRLSSG